MTGEDGRHTALQDHLAQIRSAPLPLREDEAMEKVAELRMAGLSYNAIARVMAMYHGHFYSPWCWRDRARAAGFPAKGSPR